MKTKAQKVEQIKEVLELLKKSRTLVFSDFTGVNFEELKKLRKSLKAENDILEVVKKRLFRVALKNNSTDFNPEQFDSQLAVVFSQRDLPSAAGTVYKFYRELLTQSKKERFKILGAYDLANQKYLDAAETKFIGQLPPREVLLAQLVGMLAAPIRMFLYVLSEKSKQTVEANKNS